MSYSCCLKCLWVFSFLSFFFFNYNFEQWLIGLQKAEVWFERKYRHMSNFLLLSLSFWAQKKKKKRSAQ